MSLGRRPVSVVRPGGAYDAHGRWQETTSAQPFTVWASVQPLSGQDLESLPEGRRATASFRLYTDYRLRTIDDKAAANPDRVTFAIAPGAPLRTYEVIHIDPWQNGIVPHYKAVISLLEQEPDGVAP